MCCENIKPLLSAFVDGALDENERRKVKEHLAACEACAAEERMLRELSHEVRTMPVVNAPPGFADALREKMDAHDADRSSDTKVISSSRFRRPVWLGVAASFILAGVTIAFLIVSQIEMHSLSENSMAAPDKRQVADHSPVTELDSEIHKRLKELGYSSAPAEKTDGAIGPGAPKRSKKGPRVSTLERNAKGPRTEPAASADQDMPTASRLFENDALSEAPLDRPDEIASEDMTTIESELGYLAEESTEGMPDIADAMEPSDHFLGVVSDIEDKITPMTDSGLILIVDSNNWRMPKHLVAMANSTGRGIMDFTAPIGFPKEKSESSPASEKRNQGKGGKGPAKGPGEGGVGGLPVKEAKDNKADLESIELKDESGEEWVCVYLDAEADALPELIADLALTSDTQVWRGSLVPEKGTSYEDDGVEEQDAGAFAGLEVSVSRIPWIDRLVAVGGSRIAPDRGRENLGREAEEPLRSEENLAKSQEEVKSLETRRGAGVSATTPGVSSASGKNHAKTVTVGNKPFQDEAGDIDTTGLGSDLKKLGEGTTNGLTQPQKILIIFPKRALVKEEQKE